MTDLSRMTNEQLLAAYQAAKGGAAPAKPARLSAQEQSELQTARAAAQSRAAAAKDAERFLELNRRAGTGQVWGLPFASEIRGAFDSDFAGMQSLTNRMAPAQREAGSGAMSDKDVALFKKSVPNPDFTGPTNTGIARRMQEDAKRAADYAAFLDEFAATRGTLVGAQAAWQARKARPAAPAAPAAPPRKPAASTKGVRVLSIEPAGK
jgi:hypothetical protein